MASPFFVAINRALRLIFFKKPRKTLVQSKYCFYLCTRKRNNGAIAQLVEQRTENPCVPGSIPGGTTLKKSKRQARKKRQNITVRGGAKGGDKRWSKNLHRIRLFFTDCQYFA